MILGYSPLCGYVTEHSALLMIHPTHHRHLLLTRRLAPLFANFSSPAIAPDEGTSLHSRATRLSERAFRPDALKDLLDGLLGRLIRAIEPEANSSHRLANRVIKDRRPWLEDILIWSLFVAAPYYVERWSEVDQQKRTVLDIGAKVVEPAGENLCDDNREFRLEKSVGEPRCDTRAQAQLPRRFRSERRFERSSTRHNQPQEVVRVDTNTAVEAPGQKPSDRALTGALRAVDEKDRSLRSSSQRKSNLHAIELKTHLRVRGHRSAQTVDCRRSKNLEAIDCPGSDCSVIGTLGFRLVGCLLLVVCRLLSSRWCRVSDFFPDPLSIE